jgi:hypothetical protein
MSAHGVSATLGLLQGPTKLLVASAVASIGADVVLSAHTPALCYVARWAYDQDVFTVRPARLPS